MARVIEIHVGRGWPKEGFVAGKMIDITEYGVTTMYRILDSDPLERVLYVVEVLAP